MNHQPDVYRRLPLHPAPQDDELLSSWLVRLAYLHRFKVHSFCALFFGRHREVWTRDIDRYCPDWLVRELNILTGCSSEQILRASLVNLGDFLGVDFSVQGRVRQLLPLGIYHRTRQRYGMQFCPQCLAEDTQPYFRRTWRLALQTICLKHELVLRDRSAAAKALSCSSELMPGNDAMPISSILPPAGSAGSHLS